MAYAYSSYAGSMRPESSLATIDEGISHSISNSNNSIVDNDDPDTSRIPSRAAYSSPKTTSLNLLPPGHQSPSTRIPSTASSTGAAAGSRIPSAGSFNQSSNSVASDPARARNGTGASTSSTISSLSLNDSELFRGAQNALAHLHLGQDSQHPSTARTHDGQDEPTATSIALSQHYRHAPERGERIIEEENLTGISAFAKTPMPPSRQQRVMIPASPSLPSSLRNAMQTPETAQAPITNTTMIPRSKSVTFSDPDLLEPSHEPASESQLPSPTEEVSQSEAGQESLNSTEQAMLTEWTRVPPSESSPPSRSMARSSPRRSPSPLDAPSSPSPPPVLHSPTDSSPLSSPSPAPRITPARESSTTDASTSRSLRGPSLSPSAHTSVAHTPSRLRNVVTLTETESSIDTSIHHSERSLGEGDMPESSQPVLHQSHSSPSRKVARTPSHPPPSAALSLETPALSKNGPPGLLTTDISATKSSPTAVLISGSSATPSGAGGSTFATAESYTTTPSSLASSARTPASTSATSSQDSDTKKSKLTPSKPRYPSLFGEGPADSLTEDVTEKEAKDDVAPGADDSLSQLTRATHAIGSATAMAFAQLGGAAGSDRDSDATQGKKEAVQAAPDSADTSVDEGGQYRQLSHGADLVKEMHDLHAALRANLMRRLQAAERERGQEREDRLTLERNVKRLIVGLMGDSLRPSEDAEQEGEEGEAHLLKTLFAQFRLWALDVSAMQKRRELLVDAASSPNASRTSGNQSAMVQTSMATADSTRVLHLQSEVERLEEELEMAEREHHVAALRVEELEAEREELRDEQGVFELELAAARRERDEALAHAAHAEEAEEEQDEDGGPLAEARRRIAALEIQVAAESSARSQADAYRRRLEEGFEVREAELREAAELAQRECERLGVERASTEEGEREVLFKLETEVREREVELADMVEQYDAERRMRLQLQAENDRLVAAAADAAAARADQEEASNKLRMAEQRVDEQSARIKELEKESANTALEVAKLLKARDRMEQDNANLAMGLAAKQQELSLLKRNGLRNPGDATSMTMGGGATPLGLKTPRASEHRRKHVPQGSEDEKENDPQSTVRRRPPTAVLQSLILNMETPLPSSRIANRDSPSKRNRARPGVGDGSESDRALGGRAGGGTKLGYAMSEEEEELGDEVTPLRDEAVAAARRRVAARPLGSRTSLGSTGVSAAPTGGRMGLVSRTTAARNDENAAPSTATRSGRVSNSAVVGTKSSAPSAAAAGIAARKAGRTSAGSGLSSTSAALSAAASARRAAGRTSLGSLTAASVSRLERERVGTSRAGAASPTPSQGSVASATSGYTSTAASSVVSAASTRTGVLRSAAASARKSGVDGAGVGGRARISGVGSRDGEHQAAGAGGSTLMSRRPSTGASVSRASLASGAAARTSVKRSSPDDDLGQPAPAPGSRPLTRVGLSTSASASSSRSTVIPRPSTALGARRPSASFSNASMANMSASLDHASQLRGRSLSGSSASAARDEEMTEAELSGRVSVGPSRVGSASTSLGLLGARRFPSVARNSLGLNIPGQRTSAAAAAARRVSSSGGRISQGTAAGAGPSRVALAERRPLPA
ncbi:hypothetical protein V8E36_009432 [Tilletia maclaganii]